MDDIRSLFDEYAKAYQHSKYAITHAIHKAKDRHNSTREQILKRFQRERSKSTTISVNRIMADIHELNDLNRDILDQPDSILRAAEHLSFGSLIPDGIDKLLFSHSQIPWIMPFLGHQNLLLESNGDACQALALQFAVAALKQTAAGQLSLTVINPNLRATFSSLSTLPDFRMLTTRAEIAEEFSNLSEEIIKTSALLKRERDTLLDLRNSAQQPIGRLKLLIIQDIPRDDEGGIIASLERVAYGAPRIGTTIIIANGKQSQQGKNVSFMKDSANCSYFFKRGEEWRCSIAGYEHISFRFPSLTDDEILECVSQIQKNAINSSAITLPFQKIEDTASLWRESSVKHLTFSLGMRGLDRVEVCIGDQVSQLHNILISGAAGKGKSNLIEVMIHSLCCRYSPDELELYLLDFKDGLTFKPYGAVAERSWLPHARMLGIESERDVGLAVLKDLEEERKRRAIMFRNSTVGGIHDYESYRKAFPNEKLPRIVLVIDEYQKLFDINDEISSEASDLLENLVRQGRASSIHIVLASQSITGTVGLLGKDERIYAQFPVRIALQNTLSESYSLFGLGNDAAAQLRVRGEAVLNCSYGAKDANQKFTVAYAEPEEMKTLRNRFCASWKNQQTPVVFGRNDVMEMSMIIPELRKWRDMPSAESSCRIPCGIQLSTQKKIVTVSFANDIGKNIAILGAAEDLQDDMTVPGKKNIAIGMLETMAISLALQHTEGNARFVLIDGLDRRIRSNSEIDRWQQLMERFGYPVEIVPAAEVATWLKSFRNEVNLQQPEEDTYLLGAGMDRCSGFTDTDLTGESGADVFQQLLRFGSRGVHFICWWSNVATFNSHLGFGNDGYFNTKILLRMNSDSAKDVLGPFINWSVRDNRALIHDESDLKNDEIVIPFIPMTRRVCGQMEAEVW